MLAVLRLSGSQYWDLPRKAGPEHEWCLVQLNFHDETEEEHSRDQYIQSNLTRHSKTAFNSPVRST